jgi:hypothetical protein
VLPGDDRALGKFTRPEGHAVFKFVNSAFGGARARPLCIQISAYK